MFTRPVGGSKLPSAVTEFELYCSKLILRIIPRISGPITFLSGFPDQSVLGTSSW